MTTIKERIRDWLDIKDPVQPSIPEISDELKRELDFWKRQLSKNAATKKCTKCRKPIKLWPFEEDGYYIKGKRVTHMECNK